MIKGYQILFRPYVGHHCRFYPTCSDYAIQSIHSHGLIKGWFYAINRLLRCHPWSKGGIDPIPKN